MINVDEIHEELPTIEAYGARHPDEYAGAYVEHTPPRRVCVGFTRRHEAHHAELTAEFPYRRWLSVFEAGHTLRELKQTRERLRTDEDDLRELGVRTGAVGLEIADNCVWLEAWRLEPRQRDLLTQRYGSPLKIIDVTEGQRVAVRVLDVRVDDERDVVIRYVTGGDREVSTAELSRDVDVWTVKLFAEVAPWVNLLERNRQVREITVRVGAPER